MKFLNTLLLVTISVVLINCKGSSNQEADSAEYVRVNANTNPRADRILALYAYGQAIIQSKDCTDPGSWFYQGSMHAVPPKASIPGCDTLCAAYNSGKTYRGWNSCPHMYPTSSQLNFPTWHRLYIYYYERNIRHHIANGGDGFPGLGESVANQFSLPYWDYTNQGLMPASFRTRSLADADIDLPKNPLYDVGRSPTLMMGQPIAYDALDSIAINVDGQVKNLCVKTMRQALDIQKFLSLTDISEFSRGMEDRLHNVMHDYIGGAVDDTDKNTEIYNRIYQQTEKGYGLMGYIPSAGFDPIFFLHHSNIDRLFAAWEAINGPVTIAQMEQYGGDWNTIKDIYEFWDAPTNSWITYGTMQEMLDAVHSIDYSYENLPSAVASKKSAMAKVPVKVVYENMRESAELLGTLAKPYTIVLSEANISKSSTDARYKLEVDVSFGKNMLEQLLIFSIPDDMDWNACELDDAYVHSVSAVFGSTHDMEMGGQMSHGKTRGQDYQHKILMDVTEAVNKSAESKSGELRIYIVPLNAENGADFYLNGLRLFKGE